MLFLCVYDFNSFLLPSPRLLVANGLSSPLMKSLLSPQPLLFPPPGHDFTHTPFCMHCTHTLRCTAHTLTFTLFQALIFATHTARRALHLLSPIKHLTTIYLYCSPRSSWFPQTHESSHRLTSTPPAEHALTLVDYTWVWHGVGGTMAEVYVTSEAGVVCITGRHHLLWLLYAAVTHILQ